MHVEAEDFEGAMRALAELRPAVDAFFDKVTVNADDPALRANRLKLLNMLRRATLTVADFLQDRGVATGSAAQPSSRAKGQTKSAPEGALVSSCEGISSGPAAEFGPIEDVLSEVVLLDHPAGPSAG